MDSCCTADLAESFELLGLMEVVSFEDFDFALAFTQMKASLLSQPEGRTAALPAGHSGKNLFLISPKNMGSCMEIGERDIACVDARVSSPILFSEAMYAFDVLAKRDFRTCLLYNMIAPMSLKLSNATEGERCVEWEFSSASERRASGFLFSRNWKEGVCNHMVKVLDNYAHTLSPLVRSGFSHHVKMREMRG